MADSNSWADKSVQASIIEAAGGLNKPLILKGSGTGGHMFYQPVPVALDALTQTATPAQLRSGLITTTSGNTVTITLPTAVDLAAYINGGAAARNGTKLQVGSAFDIAVINTGSNGITMTASTGITLVGEAVVVGDTSSVYRLRFTDVTVGAEVAVLYNLATSA